MRNIVSRIKSKWQLPDLTKIVIPTQRHIRRYLEFHYGRPIALPDMSIEMKALKLYLSKPTHRFDNYVSLSDYRTWMILQLPPETSVRDGFHLTKSHIREFNSLIESMIRQELRMYCNAAKFSGIEIKDAIFGFMKENGLSENVISYDALVKYYYRFRKRKRFELPDGEKDEEVFLSDCKRIYGFNVL